MKQIQPRCLRRFVSLAAASMFFVVVSAAQDIAPDSSGLMLTPDQASSSQVNIAYGTQPDWLVSSSVRDLKADELRKVFTPNLLNTLKGRIPGLTVISQNSEPGIEDPSLFIRGVGTFGPGRSPLILLDGFECTIDHLNPAEIESVTILNDASATAIYGTMGANGVILLTTKIGEAGPLKAGFNVQAGLQDAIRLPEYLGSYDYARLYNEALLNDGNPALYSQSDLEMYQNGSDPFLYPNVDWYSQNLRSFAPMSRYTLDFRGGNGNVKYFTLLSYENSGGLYIKSGDLSKNSLNFKSSRFNFRSNVEVSLTKSLSATIILGGAISDRDVPSSVSTEPMFNLMSAISPNAFPVFTANGNYGGNSLYSNPYGDLLETGFYSTNARTIQTTLVLSEDLSMITQGLKLSGTVSFNNYFNTLSSKTREYAMESTSVDESGNVTYTTIGQNTSLTGDESQAEQWQNFTTLGVLDYNRDFGAHGLTMMMMIRWRTASNSEESAPYKYLGMGGRLTYNYDRRYIIEGSMGYSGTDNFPVSAQYGFFPAVSLGWIVSNESFLEGSNLFSFLKIRGSYGLSGNDLIGGKRYMFDQYYRGSAGYYFGPSNNYYGGSEEGQIANPDVTWEKDKKMNVGVEVTLKDRLEVSFDYFQNKRYDILAIPYTAIPFFVGVDYPDLNTGKVNNSGFEAIVGFHTDQSSDFFYSVSASAWYARNEIVENGEPLHADEYLYLSGHPVDQPFLLEQTGFFNDPSDVSSSPFQTFDLVQEGDMKYKDQNGDGLIDQNDFYPIGKPMLPELSAALNMNFSYKGFDLSIFFHMVSGRSVYLSGYYYEAFQNDGKVGPIALGRWTPQTAATATYPRLSAKNNLNNFQPSSFWQRDGSFIKLRSIEFGYTLPVSSLQRIGVSNARVYLNGTNLFSFDHVDYADPEILSGYPALRNYSIGFSMQF